MNSYLKTILLLSVIGGIINSLIIPQNKVKKYVSYFISLIMILVILSPIFKFISSFENVKEYISNFYHSIRTEEIIEQSNSLIVKTSEENVCNGIKEIIISKFGFEKTDVYVSINCDKSDISCIKINEVTVILTNKASWSNIDAVKEYLDKTVGCKINVTRR